jgi:hypothetical protein
MSIHSPDTSTGEIEVPEIECLSDIDDTNMFDALSFEGPWPGTPNTSGILAGDGQDPWLSIEAELEGLDLDHLPDSCLQPVSLLGPVWNPIVDFAAFKSPEPHDLQF